MPYACIDIGSNTTRLLVAEVQDGQLRELMAQRAFTKIGRSASKKGKVPRKKIEETAEVVATQARLARELGATEIVIVATAAIRDAPNRDEIAARLEERAGEEVKLLSGKEEARLSFVGATKTLGAPVEGAVSVVDVGGGSTEIGVGTVAGGAEWSESFRIGSGFLADAYLASDPPSVKELHAVRQHVAGVFEGLDVPPSDRGVAVGGSATSLRRLVGASLEHETLERAVRLLSTTERAELAALFELDPERVRVLPAGILVFEEISDRMGMPLQIGKGGLREGVILECIGEETAVGQS
ncbi:MAG: hypothetical protein H0T15_03840 [Thermoleophilaceae bacterium]|nr:hypothetical protein [Thermoleophilaceae bacterium]